MLDTKVILAFAVLVIGIFLMPVIGWGVGLIVIPLLVVAAVYLFFQMLKSFKQ